jgi:hypothetical protein
MDHLEAGHLFNERAAYRGDRVRQNNPRVTPGGKQFPVGGASPAKDKRIPPLFKLDRGKFLVPVPVPDNQYFHAPASSSQPYHKTRPVLTTGPRGQKREFLNCGLEHLKSFRFFYTLWV